MIRTDCSFRFPFCRFDDDNDDAAADDDDRDDDAAADCLEYCYGKQSAH